MKLKIILISLTMSLLTSFNAFAGPTYATPLTSVGGSQTQTENRVYAGLVWTLKQKASTIPDLTLGFRSLRVKSTDSVNGLEVSTRIKFKEGILLDSARLSFVGGERNVLGNVGVGYSVVNSSFLGTLAVQGSHSRLGADYLLTGNKFVPYIEALTLNSPNKVQPRNGSTSYVCEDGFELNGEYNGQPTCGPIGESDIRLKDHIEQVATLSNGLKIYSFKYKSREGSFVGVMAQDLLANAKWSKAVIKRQDGFYMVNYSMLGIKMTTLENWHKNGNRSILLNKS